MADIIDFTPANGREPGTYALADLPQRGSVAEQAFGSGWFELDNILKFYLGQFIVVTGIAGHGKSTFVLNVLLKMALEQSVKSFMYVPENEAHLKEKLRGIWLGDDTSFNHFCRSQCFVRTSASLKADEPRHDIEWVLERAEKAVHYDGVEVVLIDPWNELERSKPKDMLMTDYIGFSLMRVKEFCRTCEAVVIIAAHPTKAINQTGGKIVSLADIEGSMNWFNKCDNGLIVVRDSVKNAARVISAKVREIGAGKLGSCPFHVDPFTGKFTPQYGGEVGDMSDDG